MSLSNLALDHLVLSETPAQAERRKHFGKGELDELVKSIVSKGVLQPIIVRPCGANGTHEIVAGERRYLATKLAGLAEIPAISKAYSDEEVVQIQLIENQQRKSMHELEEAEAYHELLHRFRLTMDELVAQSGKSIAYIYARLKLRDLCKDVKAAVWSGKITASNALLLARLNNEGDQKKMLKVAIGDKGYGPLSFRELKHRIDRECMLELKNAPFETKSASLVPTAGPCTTCPKRTGNQPALFDDEVADDLCTDSACFNRKRQAHIDLRIEQAREDGIEVITGAKAKEIFRDKYSDGPAHGSGFVSLDSTDYNDAKMRKVRQIIGSEVKPALAVNRKGDLVEIVPTSALAGARRKKGIKTHAQEQAAASKKTAKKAERQKSLNARIFDALKVKWPDKLGRPELEHIAQDLSDNSFEILHPPRTIAKLSDRELTQFIYTAIYTDQATNPNKSTSLFAMAKRQRVNVDAIKRAMETEKKAPAKATTAAAKSIHKLHPKPAKKKKAAP